MTGSSSFNLMECEYPFTWFWRETVEMMKMDDSSLKFLFVFLLCVPASEQFIVRVKVKWKKAKGKWISCNVVFNRNHVATLIRCGTVFQWTRTTQKPLNTIIEWQLQYTPKFGVFRSLSRFLVSGRKSYLPYFIEWKAWRWKKEARASVGRFDYGPFWLA